ncbi:MAG: inositol monophosphatase family protein [Marvinbryantia sp.]|uniref:inositol monophosphatase family protein n=1 Tax=Marvinbryantia sp. TaxID=2496532 RepID=UPI0025F8531D|nr:inositol monophosphatase family protein [uncultured Marvinbryantia sp.]
MGRYSDLLEKVKKTAREVAKIAKNDGSVSVKQKGAKDFVTEVDMRISDVLCEKLPGLLEGSIVISEEGYKGKPDQKYCWIIDPIDGTSNFIYSHPDYAISIGLLENAEPVLGVVYSPQSQEMFYAAKGEGAYCNGKRIFVCRDASVSQTLVLAETNPYSDRVANKFPQVFSNIYRDCIDYRITGSAALDCCYIACGRGGAFIAENLKPWDYAAGEIIVREAGGSFSQWDGRRPTYYGNTTALATNTLVHEEILGRLKQYI